MRTGAATFAWVALLAGCEVQSPPTTGEAIPQPSAPLSAMGLEVLDESDFQPRATATDPYGALYDPSQTTTIRGPVLGVRRATTSDQRVFLILEIGVYGEVIDAILAPEDFLNQQGLAVSVTENIEATGARTTRNTRDAVVVRRVRDNRGTFDLRDASGRPLWR